MPQPSMLSFLGIGKEASGSYGTPVAATTFIPITGEPKPVDQIKYLEDKGWRGSMTEDYGEIPGPWSSTYSFDGDVYMDSIGHLLRGILGDMTETGASAPYTHTFALLNSGNGQPPSYTVSDYYTVNTRQWPGLVFSEVGFKFNADGLLTYTAKAEGLPSVTTTKPTATFTPAKATANWTGVSKINAVATKLIDGEFSIKRKVSPIQLVNGVQAPAQQWGGPLSCDGKMTLVMEDDTAITAYQTNTQPSLDVLWSSGSGATLQSLELHATNAAYTAAAVNRGKDWVEVEVTWKAIANSTDAGTSGGLSPIKATLQNAIASGTY